MTGSMMNLDLPYLFAPRAKGKRYYYYRRDGRRIPIADEAGNKPTPETDLPAFLAAYNRIQESFSAPSPIPLKQGTGTGSLAHTITSYLECPEYKQLADKTRSDYRRYLDALKAYKGDARLSVMPPEFLTQLRNKYANTPRTANYMLAVMRLVLKHAEALPNKFGMPSGWRMPGKWPTKLKTGEGRHKAWEEFQIAAFRRRWGPASRERVAFELLINTGQRGGDVVQMTRQQYVNGSITLTQRKTGVRLEIPVAQDLKVVLDPWLKTHAHVVILTGEKGGPLGVDYFRHMMADAYAAAGLEGVTTHGLRYTTATILSELGCDWVTISDITGHRTAEMARKYSERRRRSRMTITRLDTVRRAQRSNKDRPKV